PHHIGAGFRGAGLAAPRHRRWDDQTQDRHEDEASLHMLPSLVTSLIETPFPSSPTAAWQTHRTRRDGPTGRGAPGAHAQLPHPRIAWGCTVRASQHGALTRACPSTACLRRPATHVGLSIVSMKNITLSSMFYKQIYFYILK